ncbi:MAG: hypothetical protein ABSA10_05015 [Anaerolineales bacterium]
MRPIKTGLKINVPDAIQWLNTCATRAMGEDPGIDRFPVAVAYGEPKVLLAENSEGRRFLLSVFAPDTIRHIHTSFRWPWPFSYLNRLRSNLHPLVPLSRRVETYQLSMLNCGSAFELEATQVWKRLTGDDFRVKELWLYILPSQMDKDSLA